jgi:hypothetical protein
LPDCERATRGGGMQSSPPWQRWRLLPPPPPLPPPSPCRSPCLRNSQRFAPSRPGRHGESRWTAGCRCRCRCCADASGMRQWAAPGRPRAPPRATSSAPSQGWGWSGGCRRGGGGGWYCGVRLTCNATSAATPLTDTSYTNTMGEGTPAGGGAHFAVPAMQAPPAHAPPPCRPVTLTSRHGGSGGQLVHPPHHVRDGCAQQQQRHRVHHDWHQQGGHRGGVVCTHVGGHAGGHTSSNAPSQMRQLIAVPLGFSARRMRRCR